MKGGRKLSMGGVQYELEIAIQAPIDKVWQAIINDIQLWWLGDFHMVAPDSQVELDVRPGGRGLMETAGDGSFLQWYTVQAYLPQQRKIYLVGNLAPEFGGPSTSNLSLELISDSEGCTLKITDAHHGCVDEQTIDSLEKGWKQLFDSGLRCYVEDKAN
ncbi:MAG: SRPBCC domain-containing protein [Planctomycetales bacterium]|nr:SRPBCC domain-containing protein [Planctomycetales bacterium]